MIDVIKKEEITSLQGLFKGIDDDSDNYEPACKEIFPVEIPDREEDRVYLNERLIALFQKGLKNASLDKHSGKIPIIPNYYPVPGEPNANLNSEDIPSALFEASKLLPCPTDPKFAEAIRNRQAGIIALLSLIVNLQAYGRDTGATLRNLQMLTRESQENKDKEGNPANIKEVPWEQGDKNSRKEILIRRGRAIQQNIEIVKLRIENIGLSQKVYEMYEKAGLIGEFNGAWDTLNEGMKKFTASLYLCRQLVNVFYRKLLKVDLKNTEQAKLLLKSFIADLVIARTEKDFTEVINAFAKQADKEVEEGVIDEKPVTGSNGSGNGGNA